MQSLRRIKMNIVTLLEKLATSVHHNNETIRLINEQDSDVKNAFSTNSNSSLRELITSDQDFAHESHVVQITN